MLRKIGYNFIFYSGIGFVANAFSRRPKGIILAYHRVAPAEAVSPLLKDLSVQSSSFERQLAYLKRDYKVISLEQALEYVKNGSNSLNNTVVITFDDAYEDNYLYAFPVLRKYGLPATIFVSTGFIGNKGVFWWERLGDMLETTQKKMVVFSFKNKNYCFKLGANKRTVFFSIMQLFKESSCADQKNLIKLLQEAFDVPDIQKNSRCLSWKQMQEMSEYNITFGSHTHSHCALSSVSHVQLAEEIRKSKELIESNLKKRVTLFAYPFGEKDDFNEETIAYISQAGYSCALTMMQGPFYPKDNLFMLRRVGVGGNDGNSIFRLKSMGLVPLFG